MRYLPLTEEQGGSRDDFDSFSSTLQFENWVGWDGCWNFLLSNQFSFLQRTIRRPVEVPVQKAFQV